MGSWQQLLFAFSMLPVGHRDAAEYIEALALRRGRKTSVGVMLGRSGAVSPRWEFGAIGFFGD